MNVLLTGAQGNFGVEFCRQAQNKADLTVIPVGRDDWASIDQKLATASVVIHAASDLRTSAAASPTKLLNSNLMSTAALLEASRKQAIKKFIFLSSCAVYGEDMTTAETSLCCPISINGISKHLNEKLIAEFCTFNAIEYQIVRVFNSYGSHDNFSILSRLKQSLLLGTPFTLNNNGRMLRDFIHIADVAAILVKLATTDITHTHVNVGTGVATKISSLVDMVTAQFPQLVIKQGWSQEAEYSRADTTRLREVWTADFVRIEDYVQDEFRAYVKAG